MSDDFWLMAADGASGRDTAGKRLEGLRLPAELTDHKQAAKRFQADRELVVAINTALALGAPLLLTGEPGTGKTQVAYFVAWYFDMPEPFPLHVGSSTTAANLLYEFDHVGYFRATHDAAGSPELLDAQGRVEKRHFLLKGPLWKAFEAKRPSVVLIDEIDKAPRDFPNDILTVIDQHRFDVRELQEKVERAAGSPPPFIVITSNSERRLPEPFLRRCVFHHITFSDTTLARAVEAHKSSFAGVSDRVIDLAVKRFKDLRSKDLRKPPATSELLAWLVALNVKGVGVDDLAHCPLAELPCLGVLIKDHEDRARL